MLNLKLQYFGHLMWRVDSLEKTLMLGGIGGRRGRGWLNWNLSIQIVSSQAQGTSRHPLQTMLGLLRFSEQIHSSVQLLSRVRLFETPWIAALQASLSITNTQSYPNPCPSSQWCHSAISSSVIPFSSCPPQCLPPDTHVQLLSPVQLFATPWSTSHGLLCSWDFPSNNTGVGCHFLLQVIFLTQGLNSCLLHPLHCQGGSLSLSHLGSPLPQTHMSKFVTMLWKTI